MGQSEEECNRLRDLLYTHLHYLDHVLILNNTHTHTHTLTHSLTHTRTHTDSHTHTHTHTLTHTHTHTQTHLGTFPQYHSQSWRGACTNPLASGIEGTVGVAERAGIVVYCAEGLAAWGK